eukprot:scaffold42926_cov21-Prasinocladus_malaysianus.AAC.2
MPLAATQANWPFNKAYEANDVCSLAFILYNEGAVVIAESLAVLAAVCEDNSLSDVRNVLNASQRADILELETMSIHNGGKTAAFIQLRGQFRESSVKASWLC